MMNEIDKMKPSGISDSLENYLKAVFLLRERDGAVRSVDLAEYVGYSKPSISHAVALLEKDGYLIKEKNGNLTLTESGRKIAQTTYEKHCFFKAQLMDAGVEREVAEREACRMEHAISEESFEKLKINIDRKGDYGI